jgi:hypothetical protein
MAWLRAVILPIVWLIASRAGIAWADKLRLLAPGRAPQELTYTVTVRDGAWWAGGMIAFGALLSYGMQWWVGKRRARLVQQRDLERLRDRLRTRCSAEAWPIAIAG